MMMLRSAVLAVLAAGGTAAAATPPATDAPPLDAKPAKLDGDSPIAAIAATPAGKAALEKHLPVILAHPAYEQFKGMSLRALAPLSGGQLTDDKIAAVEADLKAAS